MSWSKHPPQPESHISSGGRGARYYIGGNLARVEVSVISDVLADLAPDIEKISEPRRLRSGYLDGIKELQVEYP